MNPLIWKELREQAKWAPIALTVIGLMLWRSLPRDVGQAVVYGETALTATVTIFILLASALGYLQSRLDCQPEARAHLLHRPISRGQIFRAKWIAAAVLYFSVTLIPLFATAIWLETTGLQKLPTTWIQALPSIAMAVSCFAFYFATMWTIYRPARWFGTRLLPFVGAAIVPTLTYSACFTTLASGGIWILVELSIGLWLCAAGAKHAFCRLADLPPASSALRDSRSSAIVFLACGVVLCWMLQLTTLRLMPVEITKPSAAQVTQWVTVTSNGRPWRVRYDPETPDGLEHQRLHIKGPNEIRAANPRHAQVMPDDFIQAPQTHFIRLSNKSLLPTILRPFNGNSHMTGPDTRALVHIEWGDPQSGPSFDLVNDRSGRLLCYDRRPAFPGLKYVITPDEFRPLTEAESACGFANPISHILNMPSVISMQKPQLLFVDQQAVYLIDFSNLTVQPLISAPVDAYATRFTQPNHLEYLWLQQKNAITGYSVTWTAGTNAAKTPQVDFKPTVTLTIPENIVNRIGMRFFDLDDGFAAMSPLGERPVTLVTYNKQGQRQSTETFSDIPPTVELQTSITLDLILLAATSPPINVALYAITEVNGRESAIEFTWHQDRDGLFRWWAISLASAVAAAVVTFWLTGRRGRPRRSRILWTWTAVLLSWPAVLTVIALFPSPVRIPCSYCGKRRRIDQSLCDHCQAAWETGQDQRISIIEHAAPPAQPTACTTHVTS